MLLPFVSESNAGAQNDNNENVLEHSVCDCLEHKNGVQQALTVTPAPAIFCKRLPPSGNIWEMLNDSAKHSHLLDIRREENKYF